MCQWGRFFLARFLMGEKTCQKEPSPLAHESKETIPAGTLKKVRVLGKK
jgi:hypothetical protein